MLYWLPCPKRLRVEFCVWSYKYWYKSISASKNNNNDQPAIVGN